ncbi:hypothetical protein K474DRAFT_1668817 [Panus rudis PR-1116 ss-1]|nr:hypothetical protein K474DRAFT_1668817 [Panus rudis PR-1116 ss-1]
MSTVSAVERASRRRTVDLPTKPEAGLAEWTSKIKAMQRQVDQDEEEETKRLEQEIAASRAARLRRSMGATSQSNSVDLSKSEVAASLKEIDALADSNANTRQQNQDDALKKLSSGGPSSAHTARGGPAAFVKKAEPSPEPMSLAAFIGGRATGPRLTKHAPQQDAHDPTQFEQRTHITSPHPIFGRGGIAMPGMTSRDSSSQGGMSSTPLTSESDRRTRTPSVVKSFIDRVEEGRLTAQKTGASSSSIQPIRVRTTSTPSSPRSATFEKNIVPVVREPSNIIPTSAAASPAPTRPSFSPASPPVVAPLTPRTSSRPVSTSPHPRPLESTRTPPPPTSPYSPSKSPGITPSISKSVPSQPRQSVGTPQPVSSPSPSSAYLRPPPSKEPTPSISRLQGRGFVQSVVRASSQLEAAAQSSSSSPKIPESGRKSSVLERWQHDSGRSGTAPPPIIAPKPVTMRKTKTIDTGLSTSPIPTSPSPVSATPPRIKPDYTGRSLKSAVSMPSVAQAYNGNRTARSEVGTESSSPASSRTQALGSGNTLISYIKPLKTGDDPITNKAASRPPSRPPSAAARSRRGSPEPDAGADEMGVRVRPRSKSISADRRVPVDVVKDRRVETHATGGSGLTGKPLSHPTKERAKKPRKARESTREALTAKVHETPASSSASPDKDARPHTATARPAPSPRPVISETDPTQLAERGPLKVGKSTVADHEAPLRSGPSKGQVGAGIRVALPGLASGDVKPTSLNVPANQARPRSTSPKQAEKVPASPIRHSRIPSTGNRATVMDVALALSEHEAHVRRLSQEAGEDHGTSSSKQANVEPAVSSNAPKEDQAEDQHVPPDVKSVVANWGPRQNGGLTANQAEKRKSSYEKYSAFVLPPLAEEKTPVSSPHGTLSRTAAPGTLPKLEENAIDAVKPPVDESPNTNVTMDNTPLVGSEPVAKQVTEPVGPYEPEAIRLEFKDEPLPKVDISTLLETQDLGYKPDTDAQTISVEVMSVVGNSANPVNTDPNVFYESEALVVVHRSKSKSSGLVATKVWSWTGKSAVVTEKEERRTQDLVRRYNTSLITISQYQEPPELIHLLGGRLAIRQGTRSRWSPENTAMHSIRALHGVIHIDEVDLHIKNLCSAFSYCVSLLGTFYVWYGRGSIQSERKAALEYAQSMAPSADNVVELSEGKNDDDEMFWMILGDRDYAQADHWRWRSAAKTTDPRIWRIGGSQPFVHEIAYISSHRSECLKSIYVVDCIWEYFVLVGSEARHRRRDIRLALSIAQDLSAETSSSKPFNPPVHVIVLPSQIPTELQLVLRGLNETILNDGHVPEHMNLLSLSEALQQLQQNSWDRRTLSNADSLPLGISPYDVSRG